MLTDKKALSELLNLSSTIKGFEICYLESESRCSENYLPIVEGLEKIKYLLSYLSLNNLLFTNNITKTLIINYIMLNRLKSRIIYDDSLLKYNLARIANFSEFLRFYIGVFPVETKDIATNMDICDFICENFLDKNLQKKKELISMMELTYLNPLVEQLKTLINGSFESYGDVSRKSNKAYPKRVTHILKRWILNNYTCPYPKKQDKIKLQLMTKLNLKQIDNWFINFRRRSFKKFKLMKMSIPG